MYRYMYMYMCILVHTHNVSKYICSVLISIRANGGRTVRSIIAALKIRTFVHTRWVGRN